MPEPEVTAVAREWLHLAEADARLARGGLAQRELFDPQQVCFHAQQAAEKALKAQCVVDGIEFAFVHDLVRIAGLLGQAELGAPESDLRWLTQWATAARYPGGDEPSWVDAERAVAIAHATVTAVRSSLPPA